MIIWIIITRSGKNESFFFEDRELIDTTFSPTQHFAHPSTGNQLQYQSIETAHTHLHVIVGGTVSSVAWTTYDIPFWLHNNVDRIHESYLAIEPDSAKEFESFQERENNDSFDLLFAPFKTEDLRDKYDTLLKPQPLVYEFISKCYQTHVYVVEKNKIHHYVCNQLYDIQYPCTHTLFFFMK